ncbi:MAG: membrane integrity-associated transporter subunit PqiC [Alphaproteobacteria bacterium]|nr:membrane integrity-associated transporter subunit PqiC [Alphaproteobacteria bacterium]
MKKYCMILSLMLLTACSFRSPNSTFYVMDSTGLRPVSDKNINVSVSRIKVPDMLNKAQMVISDKDSSQIQILEFERWAEMYPDILQSTITNDLILYLPNSYIESAYFDNQSAKYNVSVEINRLQAYRGDRVILSAWWNIKDGTGKVLKKEQGNYEAEVIGDTIQNLADAQASAVHKMSKEIALSLVKMK